MQRHHFGDPCHMCGIGHDDVEAGPCGGNIPLKILGYTLVETRWDGVEHYRWRVSDGSVHETWSHVTNRLPYYHFGLSDKIITPPPHDLSLRQAKRR